jgi:hypothetical protein
MTFETETDLLREKKAIELFVSIFGGSYQKLDPHDIDYKIFDKDNNLISYVEVKGRIRSIRDSYPLPISAKKLVKLIDKRLSPVIIWACDDGIIYGKAKNLYGDIKWGGRPPRLGSENDAELMVYYDKQREFKYVRYV